MDGVDLVLRKYDGRPHRQVTTRRLGTDAYGTWLATPRGTSVRYHYGSRRTGRTRSNAVRLIPEGAWWMAMFMARPARHDIYCDIITPAQWTGENEITVIDLDIDLIRHRSNRRVIVDDEDEFAEHRVSLNYPDDIVAGALNGAARLQAALLRNDEPFASHYRNWLAQV